MQQGKAPFQITEVDDDRAGGISRPFAERTYALSRRSLLLMASSLIMGSVRSIAAASQAGRLSIGLSAPSYYNGFCPFLNWWKQGAPLQITLADGTTLNGKDIWNAGIYLDASTGELAGAVPREVSSLSRIFFTNANSFQQGIGCDYSGEEFSVVWEGSADVRVDLLTSGGTQKNLGPNQVNFRMGQNPNNTSITLAITDRMNPPRKIQIYQTRYARQFSEGEIFNPDWLEVIKQFGVIRCMDWCAVNNSKISDFNQLADFDYCSWGQPFLSSSTVGEFGTKGGVHPEILCRLANRAETPIHVCIPHRATDEFVREYASYFRDHARVEVIYELSNECWNANFNQFGEFLELGDAFWPSDPLRCYKYYGYRSSVCMNIIRDVYGGDSRWRGAMATQTVNPAVTEAILDGVEHWRSSNSEQREAPAIGDLFKGLYVTGYFGDVTTCTQPDMITRSNPGVVRSPNHGYRTGQVVRCFFFSGMIELNQRDVTVKKIDDDSYTIDVDTSDFSAFVSDTRNYAVPSMLFKLMEESRQRNGARPDIFQTPYAYFNQQVSQSLLEGKSEYGYSTTVSIASLRSTLWPAQLLLARANGMTLQQYEGGCHFVGDAYLTGYGGNPQFTEYLLQLGHSRDVAAVYRTMYDGFHKLGGHYPSKYVADGSVSQFGCWAAVRYWPTRANHNSKDTSNPVWRATISANQPIVR